MDDESTIPALRGSGAAQEVPSTVRNTVVAGAMFVGRAVLAFGVAALVAKYLGAAGRGRVVFVSNLAGLLALAAGSGTATGINRLHSVEKIGSGVLAAGAVVVGVVAGVLVSAALLVVELVGRPGSFSDAGLTPAAWALLGLALIALIVFSNVSQVAALDNRLGIVTVAALVGASLYVAWTVVTVVAGSITVLNNVVGWAVSSIVPTVILLVAIAPSGGSTTSAGLGAVIRRLFGISLRANLASLAVLAIWRIDVVLVQARRGFTELGLYSVAVAIAEIVVVMAMALRSAMLPHHLESDEELARIIARTTRVALVFTTALAVAIAAVGPLALHLMFGPVYSQVYPALVLLLPGTVFLVLHYPLFDYLAARGRLAALSVISVLGLAINIGANYWALGRWSYVAAAVVSSITYALVFAGCVALFARQSGRSVADTVVLQRGDVDAIAEFARRGRSGLRNFRGSGSSH